MATIVPCKPESTIEVRNGGILRTVILTLFLALTFLTVGAGYGRYRFGSFSAALAYLRGEHILVDDPVQSVGASHAGGSVMVRYALTNLSAQPIKLVGVESSCACTEVQGLPTTLAALEKKEVSAKITVSEGRSNFSGSVRLFTDDDHSPIIGLKYSVRTVPSGPQSVHQAD